MAYVWVVVDRGRPPFRELSVVAGFTDANAAYDLQDRLGQMSDQYEVSEEDRFEVFQADLDLSWPARKQLLGEYAGSIGREKEE